MTPQEMENKITSMSSELALFQLNELKRNDELKNKLQLLISSLNETNNQIAQLSQNFTTHKEYFSESLQRLNYELKELKAIPKVVKKWKIW